MLPNDPNTLNNLMGGRLVQWMDIDRMGAKPTIDHGEESARLLNCCLDLPETEEEKLLYKEALQRRELRLVLAGKMKPAEATDSATG